MWRRPHTYQNAFHFGGATAKPEVAWLFIALLFLAELGRTRLLGHSVPEDQLPRDWLHLLDAV
jgi:hypothetical protein